MTINLGELYLSHFLENPADIHKLQKYPLKIIEREGLFRLENEVPPDKMYPYYWYVSSLNPSMLQDLKNIQEYIYAYKGDEEINSVLDIGCNDGALLSFFPCKRRVGIDPATNIEKRAGNEYITGFFPDVDLHGETFDVITSIAMFYDIADPHEFIRKIKDTLNPNGVWIIQMTDLYGMLRLNAFDHICHEHLIYWSLEQLNKHLNQHNMSIVHFNYNDVNGSSLRVMIKNGLIPNPRLTQEIAFQSRYFKNGGLKRFKKRILGVKHTLRTALKDLKKGGYGVSALGASTKGNTLLQVMDIYPDLISEIGEIHPGKIGKFTLTGQQIVLEEHLLLQKSVLLVLPWHFTYKFFTKKFKPWLENGGMFLQPLPRPHLITIKNGDIDTLWL